MRTTAAGARRPRRADAALALREEQAVLEPSAKRAGWRARPRETLANRWSLVESRRISALGSARGRGRTGAHRPAAPLPSNVADIRCVDRAPVASCPPRASGRRTRSNAERRATRVAGRSLCRDAAAESRASRRPAPRRDAVGGGRSRAAFRADGFGCANRWRLLFAARRATAAPFFRHRRGERQEGARRCPAIVARTSIVGRRLLAARSPRDPHRNAAVDAQRVVESVMTPAMPSNSLERAALPGSTFGGRHRRHGNGLRVR